MSFVITMIATLAGYVFGRDGHHVLSGACYTIAIASSAWGIMLAASGGMLRQKLQDLTERVDYTEEFLMETFPEESHASGCQIPGCVNCEE